MRKHHQSLYAIRKKLLILLISITFLFCAVIGRLTYLQIFDASALQTLASSQWLRDLPLTPTRGQILDRSGIVLADCSTLYDVYVRPRMVENLSELCKVLEKYTNNSYDYYYSKINGKVVSEITVAKKITRQNMLSIMDSGVKGVYFSANILRYYPYSQYLTQTIGYIGADGNGQSGLELYYDKYLFGEYGRVYTETDLVGRELSGGGIGYVDATDGYSLRLNIDYYIQSFAESIVNDALTTHNAKGAYCLVLDCETGGVLAMANAPSFDLNNVPRDDVETLLSYSKNFLVNSVYEPGSTFKIITTAASIEEGIVDDNSRFYCNGSMLVDGQKIKCWKTKGHGSQTFSEAVGNSCNCAFMQLALKLGAEKMYEYIYKFGLTRKTGIDVKGESAGLTLPLASVKNVDLARIGFGHAIAVTPIGLLRATTAAVNGGVLYSPKLCKNIIDVKGSIVYSPNVDTTSGIISANTSKKVGQLLEGVVSNGGGRMAYVDGYRIGGKTGTAQKYDDNGNIASGKYISSFLGFAPADRPKYAVLIIVDEPSKCGYYGSIVAAPYAKSLFSNIFNYFSIKPDASLMSEEYNKYFEMPSLIGENATQVGSIMRRYQLSYETEGEGSIVVEQIPAPGTSINSYVVPLIKFG